MIIVGAGLAGLIAAHAWPNARVLEQAPKRSSAAHQALLRFRSDAVARLTGVEFRRVTVRKGIWDTEAQSFAPPDIRSANLYALKCLQHLVADRSIWNVDPAERFIAPPDFYAQLLQAVGPRVEWGAQFHVSHVDGWTPVISTAPLGVTFAEAFGSAQTAPPFTRAAITVQRYEVPGADVHQTVYFPTHEHSAYRASITGGTLIVEHIGDEPEGDWDDDVAAAFALDFRQLRPQLRVGQQFGKIAPIDDAVRKAMLFRLTHEFNVYSLGRFATWRNILLDDVVDDIAVIKRLMRSRGGAYDLAKGQL